MNFAAINTLRTTAKLQLDQCGDYADRHHNHGAQLDGHALLKLDQSGIQVLFSHQILEIDLKDFRKRTCLCLGLCGREASSLERVGVLKRIEGKGSHTSSSIATLASSLLKAKSAYEGKRT